MSTQSNSTSDISHTSSLSAKMKRLQIEESLLLQSINKCVPAATQTGGEVDATNYFTMFSEFKLFSGKTKNSIREIKLIFQDIKASTSSKEMLKTVDIDDVKHSTIELENRIKTLKSFLQSELTGLKSSEQQLNQTINENPVFINKLKRQPRVHTAKYNEIVQSPVKTMMTSPFKCIEVQRFQEFMKNSANRYGGWNEYHHNIFVNHWQKHFGSRIDTFNEMENMVETCPEFHLFLHELLPKLQDICEEEILSHVKWYSMYIYLKEQQQRAIDKWRANRKVMKSAKVELGVNNDSNIKNRSNRRSIYNIDINSTVSDGLDNIKELVPQTMNQGKVRSFVRKCQSEDIFRKISSIKNKTETDHENIGGQTLLHFQKPTEQWRIKINSKDNKIESTLNNLENIKKLCIPTWRVGL